MPKQKSSPQPVIIEQFQSIRDIVLPPSLRPHGGRRPRIALQDIIAGLAWHVLQPSGTFSQSVEMLTGVDMSDSALSERRQSVGIQPWMDCLAATLRPLASIHEHPDAFYKGFRLKGVDGTTLNVGNTPPMKSRGKTKTRRGRAAFHRISCVVLSELGTHAPTALRIGINDESEAALALTILDELTQDDLLIADRYYGAGKWAGRISGLPAVPMFLLRIQKRLKSITVRKLSDGSRIVKVWDSENNLWQEIREIRAWIRRAGSKRVKVRFWTNMLDEHGFPARELVALYAMRWEQEISYREIKEHLHKDNILLSHTITTAAQEIAAILMAHAIVTRQRIATGEKHAVPPLQISFEKTLHACRNICWLTAIAGSYLPSSILQRIIEAVEEQLAATRSRKRRKRSCPRRVRQPVNKWPRLMRNEYQKGEFQYDIVKS
jgi:hypothetical protein